MLSKETDVVTMISLANSVYSYLLKVPTETLTNLLNLFKFKNSVVVNFEQI